MKKSIGTALSIITTLGFLAANHVVAGEPIHSEDYAGQPIIESEARSYLTSQAEVVEFVVLEAAMVSKGCQKIESQSDYTGTPVVRCSSHTATEEPNWSYLY